MTPLITTQETSKPREPKALDMCQALSLSEEEEQEVQEPVGKGEVRIQEERTDWEAQRCDQQVIQEKRSDGADQRFLQPVVQHFMQMPSSADVHSPSLHRRRGSSMSCVRHV